MEIFVLGFKSKRDFSLTESYSCGINVDMSLKITLSIYERFYFPVALIIKNGMIIFLVVVDPYDGKKADFHFNI